MPKMRMKASEEEKIRRLKQDIKDMKLDMKETFSVMEEMEKPKKKSARLGRQRVFVIIAVIAGGIILAGAAYIFFAVL